MSVIDKLRQKNDFTGVECEIADYILAHADEVTTMSIGALAQAAYTSNATIIRLCHKVGVAGYRDFRIELARELEKRLLERRTIDVDTPVLPNQETAEIMSNIAALSKQAVDTCYASVSTTDVRRIALAIRRAHHVYLYARGDSNLSTRLFANQLMKLGIFCIDAMGLAEGPANANTAQKGDLAIIVTYSGSTLHHMRRELEILPRRGCKTALISTVERPMGIDLGITFPHHESEQANMATYYSQACIRYILNCIYAEVFVLNYHESAERKAGVDAITSAEARAEA